MRIVLSTCARWRSVADLNWVSNSSVVAKLLSGLFNCWVNCFTFIGDLLSVCPEGRVRASRCFYNASLPSASAAWSRSKWP